MPTWNERTFQFSFNCGGEAYAGLLTKALRDALGDAVQAVRREAYEEGWRDAKAKTAKRDYFRRSI